MLFGRSPRRSCHVLTTGSRRCPMPNRHCWPASIGFTALSPALIRWEPIKATLASSSTETELIARYATRDTAMTRRTPIDRLPALRLLIALVGLSAALGACTQTGGEAVTASVPND